VISRVCIHGSAADASRRSEALLSLPAAEEKQIRLQTELPLTWSRREVMLRIRAHVLRQEEIMHRRSLAVLAISGFAILVLAATAFGGGRIGAGVHYWKTLDDIDLGDIDESGVSWVITYQYGAPSLLKFQADLEIFPKKFAGFQENALAPEALIILGKSIYAGAGIGTYYSDGEFADSPFYLLRAGLDLEIVPMLFLDVNANYRFEHWNNIGQTLEDIDTDVITLGAALRLAF
jgi:hypothetical protein